MPGDSLPLVEPLDRIPDPATTLRRLGALPHALFLDSAGDGSPTGRYSFYSADPFRFLSWREATPRALDELSDCLARFPAETIDDLPPFQGGAAGLFGYDLNRALERVPAPRSDEFQVPVLAVGIYDVVLAIDHQLDSAWLISHGFPEERSDERRRRAAARIRRFRRWLDGFDTNGDDAAGGRASGGATSVPAGRLVEQHEPRRFDGLNVTSDFSESGYRRVVQRVIDYIHAGDAFQVNLSQRLLHPAIDPSIELYLRLRERNPAPFSGYFDLGDFQIVSASPERFVQLRGDRVEARPIKGTRRRSARPEADLFAGDDLRTSEKDRAENVMIVDLLRNDLSRVCRADSIHVRQLCALESFRYVQHLVSVVEGRLEQDRTAIDIVRAAFPGGSITGAPKVRAMEIIAELEPTARGPYCGCLGYVGFDGSMDMSILIRTITAGRGWWQLPVGGGIVAQSKPAAEYEETWHKALGLLRSLR